MTDTGKTVNLKTLSAALVAVFVASCAAPSSEPGLDTPDARAAKAIFSNTCIITFGYEDSDPMLKKKIRNESTKIQYVSRGQNNWWKFGAISPGATGMTLNAPFFVNSKTKKVLCGDQERKTKGVTYMKIDNPVETNAFVTEMQKYKN